MRLKTISRVVGLILGCMGLSILLPVGCGLYYGETAVIFRLLEAVAIIVGIGFALHYAGRGGRHDEDLSHREGLAVVGIGWMIGCLAGALPYLMTGVLDNVPDAVFESVSGFTTTGATIFNDVEILPKSILLWRTLTHWLGGMGIIVLFLAILPFLGVGGMQLYLSEMSGPMGDKLKPRIKDTSIALWRIYLFLTLILLGLLLLGGMDFFNAVCHTFSTIASGGFSNWNSSMAHHASPFIQWVLIIFMYLTGISYALHYHMFKGRWRHVLKDRELRLYTLTLIASAVIISVYVHLYHNTRGDVEISLRSALFHVTSLASTTGFVTTDYSAWHGLPQFLLMVIMFIGGCGGSTSGGFKFMRVLLLLKGAYQELFRIVHPRAVRRMKLGSTIVQQDVLLAVSRYLVIYLSLFVVFSLIMASMELDLATVLSSVIACLSCVGPGFGIVGPVESYASMPDAAKCVLSLAMLLGRLETYAILLLFMPEFWRK